MKREQIVRSFEYKNDYLYIIIRQSPEHGRRSFLFCSGINLGRFDPLARGTYGIGSNPAFRGLQLLQAAVSRFANEKGARPRGVDLKPCADIAPRGEKWYHEDLLIENMSPKVAQELLRFGIEMLVNKVLSVCFPGSRLPGFFPEPRELQSHLDSLKR